MTKSKPLNIHRVSNNTPKWERGRRKTERERERGNEKRGGNSNKIPTKQYVSAQTFFSVMSYYHRCILNYEYVFFFLSLLRFYEHCSPTSPYYSLQPPFNRIELSLVKIMAMMLGDFDFVGIFHSQDYLGTENTLDVDEDDFFLTSVFYKAITYLMFAVFVAVMSIIVVNLLVSSLWTLRKSVYYWNNLKPTIFNVSRVR